MKKLIFTIALFFSFIAAIKAQTVQWAQLQETTTQSGLARPHITSDGTDVITFGKIMNSITLGSQTFNGNNWRTGYLAKHDETGNLLWAKHIEGVINNEDVTTDANQNIFISGQFWDSLYIGNLIFKNNLITGRVFIAKFDPAGNFLWARTTSQGSFAMVNSITTDGSGNIYSSGIYRDSMTINNTTLIPVGQDDIFLAKYDNNGNFQWLKGFGTAGQESLPILAGGLTNDVYLSTISRSFNSATPEGYYLKKFNNAGQEQWSKFIYHGFVNWSAHLTIDASENIYLASRLDTTLFFGNHTINYQPGTANDIFIAKISSSGNWKWARQVQTGHVTNGLISMISEKKNELNIHYSNVNAGFPPSSYNIHFLRLDTAGTIQKTNSFLNKPMFHPTNIFGINDFATDNAGNTYLSGGLAGNNSLGTINLIAPPSNPGPAFPQPSASFIAKILDNANSVTGTLFIDQNSNGMKDPGEKTYENGIVGINQSAAYATSDANGAYTLYLIPGSFNLQVLQPARHYTFSPQNHTVSFAGLGQTQNKDFALVPIPNRNDVKISVTNVTPARPGFTLKYRITFENVGTTTLSDSITLNYASNHLTYFNASVAPTNQQTGKLAWYYQNLLPNTKRDIDVSLTVAPTTSINTLFRAIATIKPLLSDYVTENNYDTLNHPVTGSFDPNDKQVNYSTITPTQVANEELLNYVIRFQNTGNDTAFTVIVRDSISNKLQMGSFELLSASHPYSFRFLENGQAEWRFNNILLPDSNRNEPGSHGFIRYRIKPKNNLVLGDEIKSRAAIYFDFNAPVLTNYATTIIADLLGVKGLKTGLPTLKVYPNPAKSYVIIASEFKKNIPATISLVNMLGQTLSKVTLPANNQIHYQMPLKDLPKGIYIIQLETEMGRQTQRLVIQ